MFLIDLKVPWFCFVPNWTLFDFFKVYIFRKNNYSSLFSFISVTRCFNWWHWFAFTFLNVTRYKFEGYTLRVHHTPGKSFAYKPELLNYLKIWISSMYSTDKNSILECGTIFYCTTFHKNKSHCVVRTRDLQIGRMRLHPLRHRDKHQSLAL